MSSVPATGRPTDLPTVVLALGSPHGDDQAGWLVVDRLNEEGSWPGWCAKLSTPWDVASHVAPAQTTLVIDACRSGAPAGTIHHWPARELPHSLEGRRSSTHGATLPEALRLLEALGTDLSQVEVYGVEIAGGEVGAPLTPAVAAGVERLVRELLCRLGTGDVTG